MPCWGNWPRRRQGGNRVRPSRNALPFLLPPGADAARPRIVTSEPELITGPARQPRGLPIAEAGRRVAATLRRSGVTMPDQDLRAVTELLIRLALSLLLNPEGQLDITDPAAIREYSLRYLARLVW